MDIASSDIVLIWTVMMACPTLPILALTYDLVVFASDNSDMYSFSFHSFPSLNYMQVN